MLAPILAATLLAPPPADNAPVLPRLSSDHIRRFDLEQTRAATELLEWRRKRLWIWTGIFGASLGVGLGATLRIAMPARGGSWCPDPDYCSSVHASYPLVFTAGLALPIGVLGVLGTSLGLRTNRRRLRDLQERRVELDYGVLLVSGTVKLRF